MTARDDRTWTDPTSPLRHNAPNQVERRVLARGVYCAIGDPDTVAEELARLHAAGFDGLALNFANYLAELPYFAQEVLPRLERLKLRAKTRTETAQSRTT
jgi:alkanesulfonate monooxygenase SsuD/methylene tetrahydromethanopterin reductase-like flavin-dependent oxidoreductase (luciferase family)